MKDLPLKQPLPPVPLLSEGHPVDWWFIFKFNAASFPGCEGQEDRKPIFGGSVKNPHKFSQQFVFASSEDPHLKKGKGCVGSTLEDPLGATFGQVYNGSYFYVIWNDQFHSDPKVGCDAGLGFCKAPWGHSKGMLAWNDKGEGFVMQVSTPSWPASGSKNYPRKTDGNTLGYIKDDNIELSQHFFSSKLTTEDVVHVLEALKNSNVVTDPSNKQIVRNGGPEAIQTLVNSLGKLSKGKKATKVTLSSGVQLISKPSDLHVPPWQLVSSMLKGIPLRVANFWSSPRIYSTTAATNIKCWDASLNSPGAVQIATSGLWEGKKIGFQGGPGLDRNHAKIGVSTLAGKHLSIFGDMNQQGYLYPDAHPDQKCSDHQNGRGGMFFVMDDKSLFGDMTQLLSGDSAPVK